MQSILCFLGFVKHSCAEWEKMKPGGQQKWALRERERDDKNGRKEDK
jgi:hypothetical protein